MNAVNVGLVTFIIQHNRIQGVFLLCKITNLLIYRLYEKMIRPDTWSITKSKIFPLKVADKEYINIWINQRKH